MSSNRREFLKHTTAAAVILTIPGSASPRAQPDALGPSRRPKTS